MFIRLDAEASVDDLGYGSLVANDLASALSHLLAPRQIDILFVDIRLDALVFGGYDVANQAIGIRPGLPVLYTSGSTLNEDMTVRFVNGGHFLQKPYSPKQLETAIEALLH